jgi:hypothetical protein
MSAALEIEDDGFITIPAPTRNPLQVALYGYERMVNDLQAAVERDDFDAVAEIVGAAYLKLHGPANE